MKKPKTDFMNYCIECGSINMKRYADIMEIGNNAKGMHFVPYYGSKCLDCFTLAYSYHKTKAVSDCAYHVRWSCFGKYDGEDAAYRKPYKFDSQIWRDCMKTITVTEFFQNAPEPLISELLEVRESPTEALTLTTIQ